MEAITDKKFQTTLAVVIFIKISQLAVQCSMVYLSERRKDDDFRTISIIVNTIAVIGNFVFICITGYKIRRTYIYKQELLAAAIFGLFYGSYIIFISHYYVKDIYLVTKNCDSFQSNKKLFVYRNAQFFATIVPLVIVLFLEFPILYLTYLMKSFLRLFSTQAFQPEESVQLEPPIELEQLVQQN